MGHHVIKMPDIGEGIAEVELITWKVEVGGPVAEDQVVAEVMTDKAMVEIPSPVAGTVVSLGGVPGQMMAVGSELIRLEVEGAGNASAASAAAAPAEPAAAPQPAAPATAAPADAVEAAPVVAPAKPAAAAAPAPAAQHDARGAVTNGVLTAGEAPLASPAVRRRAWDLGIELRFVPATGPGGRILQADLDAYAAAGGKAQPAGGSAGGSSYARRTGEQQVPIIGLRRKIAQKMQQSWSTIPHITYVEEIDVTEVEALRARLNTRWGKERGKLTLLPLLARAVVLAVRDFPQMNARFDDQANIVTRYEGVQLGIATQSEVGLSVPVVAHAESLDLWQTAAEIARLANAVRAGKATREELSGSTISLSSLGAIGGLVSTPIINHPEVAIVGVNRIIERPMFREGQVVARKLMNLSSSFDHRIVDGMDAAEFVQAIRTRLETPALLFVE
ncbi:dihydrolipoamide acetyltransferase family protein [Stenotrophomonas rhizophila]|uniref:dihydrolipoamide acetyltransferase family protein n=1 Tax=Stenotrophomonas rhizophila TaxID=216778 RepID=UPI001E38A754|nr:dihydrolipoamide acetyltransferase family protein [Stenotrophomonas rhizophila]MCC7633514.1 2-oxo acid dehydrogenase subunit E2 [Stenotrophomonas rhizophila]MCC7663001.1 2-oxo acid dehydrogenase subunit E2 [Stenotrophomonas rhizophila]